MKSRILILATWMALISSQAFSANYYWKTNGNATMNNWNIPSKWSQVSFTGVSSSSVPGANDDVFITTGNYMPTVNVNIACRSLTLTGASSLNMANYSLTVSGALSNSSTAATSITVGTGTLSCGSLTISSNTLIKLNGAGGISASGEIKLQSSSAAIISYYNSSTTLGGNISGGSITLTSACGVNAGVKCLGTGSISSGGAITIAGGKVSTISTDISTVSLSQSAGVIEISSIGSLRGTGIPPNTDTFNITGGTITLGGGNIRNTGDISVSNATITLDAGASIYGANVTLNTGAVFSPYYSLIATGNFTNNTGAASINATVLELVGAGKTITGSTRVPILSIGANTATVAIAASTLVEVSNYVTLVTGSTLTTNSTATTNSPASTHGLTLLSTPLGGGSTAYIEYNTGTNPAAGTIVGSVTVQRGVADIGSTTYHYLSSPVSDGTGYFTTAQMANSFSSTTSYNSSYSYQVPFLAVPTFTYYSEPAYDPNTANAYIATQSSTNQTYYNYWYHYPWQGYGWSGAAAGQQFAIGTGVSAQAQATSGLIQWTGPINDGSYTHTVSYTNNSSYEGSNVNDGWNLLGNPYPAPLDINAFYTTNNAALNGTFGVFMNNGTSYDGTYVLYDASTGISTDQQVHYNDSCSCYPSSASSGSWADGIVSIGQGFFAKAKSGASAVSFDNSMRVNAQSTNTNPTFFKKENRTMLDVVGLAISVDGKRDAIAIAIDKDASTAYDADRDVAKLFSPAAVSALYTLKGNSKLGIHKQPVAQYESIIPLGLQLASTTNSSFSCTQYRNTDPNMEYVLEDRAENKMTPITDRLNYSFASTTTDVSDRFYIHVINHAYKRDNLSATLALKAYTSAQYLNLSLTGAAISNATVQLVDLLGRVQYSRSLELYNGGASIPLSDIPAGIYLLVAKTTSGTLSQKVSISK